MIAYQIFACIYRYFCWFADVYLVITSQLLRLECLLVISIIISSNHTLGSKEPQNVNATSCPTKHGGHLKRLLQIKIQQEFTI